MMTKKGMMTVIAAAFLLTACETMGPKQKTGTLVGGVGGAAVGAGIGAATSGGAGATLAGGAIGLVAGGLLGNLVGNEMDKSDKK